MITQANASDAYPELYRCTLPMSLAFESSLDLASWVVLFHEGDPTFKIPVYDGWLAAVSWTGTASIDGTPIASCAPERGQVGVRDVFAGSTIKGSPGAVVLILGLVRHGVTPFFTSPVEEGPRLPLDVQEFVDITAFFRMIVFDDPARTQSAAKGWSGSSLIVTTPAGPQIAGEGAIRESIGNLILAAIPANTPMMLEVGTSKEQVACVLDFFSIDAIGPNISTTLVLENEAVVPQGDVGPLPCGWRCILP